MDERTQMRAARTVHSQLKKLLKINFFIPGDNGKWAVDWTIEGCLFLFRVFFGGIIDC